MATVGSTRKAVSTSTARTATIYNLNLINAGTEYSQSLSDTKGLIVRSRGLATLQMAFVAGDSNINYVTIKPGAVFETDTLLSGPTIYIQSDVAGVILEVVAFH